MGGKISRFLNRWRHGEVEASPASGYASAPGTAIRYSPDLIEDLKTDHKQLFALHRDMVEALRDGRQEEVRSLLQTFEDLLNAHLLTERVRLYAYMDGYFSTDARTREMLRVYRTEMDRIGDSVRMMIKKYKTLAPDSRQRTDFEHDLEELRLVLNERMSREESTLYPLYMPVANAD